MVIFSLHAPKPMKKLLGLKCKTFFDFFFFCVEKYLVDVNSSSSKHDRKKGDEQLSISEQFVIPVFMEIRDTKHVH